MLENSNSFVLLTILIVVLILVIFTLKYAVQILKARAEYAAATDASFRLAGLEKNTGEMEQRVAHLEAMLREVE